MPSRRSRAEAGLRELAGDGSRPSRCGTRPYTASRRACGSTSCSTTSSPGRTPLERSGCERRRPGGRSSTSGTSRGDPRAARGPDAVVAGRRSTSARPSRTTGSATSRRRPRRLPDCEVAFAEDASPDPRSYRVDFSKFDSAFPECMFEWTAERGADELAMPTDGRVSRSPTSKVTAYIRAREAEAAFGFWGARQRAALGRTGGRRRRPWI